MTIPTLIEYVRSLVRQEIRESAWAAQVDRLWEKFERETKQTPAPFKTVLWTGWNAPDKKVTLAVVKQDAPYQYAAFWEPGYCVCPDCHCLVGWGATPEEAIADYWEMWEDR